MLDADLAKLYRVTTASLNQAVRRNRERFPEDCMFRLGKKNILDITVVIAKPRVTADYRILLVMHTSKRRIRARNP